MTRSSFQFVVAWLVALTVLGSSSAVPQEAKADLTDEPDNTVEAVLAEVQKALIGVQRSLADEEVNLPPLQSVRLTLQTVLTRKGGGGVRFLIFSFKRPWQRQRSHELVLTLTPSAWEPKAKPEVSVAKELQKAIVDAAKGVHAAQREAQVPLDLTGLEAEIGFVVNTGTRAGAQIEILPVTFELGGDLSKRAIQRIRLTFRRS